MMIIWEIILIALLIVLLFLLITYFIKYQKNQARVREATEREFILAKENKALDRLYKAKTELYENMSHDLKTPLTVISSSVLNALDALEHDIDKDEMSESLNLAQREIMRLSRLVNDALEFSTLGSGLRALKATDLAELLQKVQKTHVAWLERKGNTLKVTISDSLPYVYVDPDTLLNVFTNLLSNANRYTQNGKIEISAFIDDEDTSETCDDKAENNAHVSKQGFVRVTVSDSGRGVDDEMMKKIFVRGESDRGSGLGLSICKSAIEAFGGTITVRSEFGKGTDVIFTLPAYTRGEDGI